MPKRTSSALTALTALAVILAMGGCARDERTETPDTGSSPATQAAPTASPTPTVSPTPAAEAGAQTATVQMKALNNSGQTGTATLTAVDATKTKVLVSLSGAATGSQPAHIHSGTCSKLGAIKYPLSTLEQGKSESTIAASLQDLRSGQFAINVHRSSGEMGVYASCGEIAP
ncbi:MAG: CHRD domain-containing protein [Actinomycetota bacterium]